MIVSFVLVGLLAAAGEAFLLPTAKFASQVLPRSSSATTALQMTVLKLETGRSQLGMCPTENDHESILEQETDYAHIVLLPYHPFPNMNTTYKIPWS
jgi:hypothetical protein